MQIRKYSKEDESSLINLLRLNTPQYFEESEEKDLIHYLHHEIEDYFVVELDNTTIVGAGGINYFPETRSARISWDFLHLEYQRKGIGKSLTLHRLDLLYKNASVDTIIVRTSQFTSLFYEKMGFHLTKTVKDFWAKNYDLYEMEIDKNKVNNIL